MHFKHSNSWSKSKSNLQRESRKPCPSPLGAGHPSHFPSLAGRHQSLFPAVESKVEGSWIRGDLKEAVTQAPVIRFSSGLNPKVEENNSRQTTLVFWEVLLGLPIRSFRNLHAFLKNKKKVFSIDVSHFKYRVFPPPTIFLYVRALVENAELPQTWARIY